EGTAALGGARSGGYGRVLFHNAAEVPDVWAEAPSGPAPDGVLTVTLVSDALVRNRYGHFAATPDGVREAVEARLGVEGLQLRASFLRGEVAGGFNRKWGLPLPQAPVVTVGSVFIFSRPAVGEDRLHHLVTQGIGERRAE